MNVNRVYSPDVYRKVMNADQEKKNDIYRYELMLTLGKIFCLVGSKSEYERPL